MNKVDKIECIKSFIDISNINEQFAERRSSELADEFTRLEVQIATILIAFAGIFLNFFNSTDVTFSNIFMLKFIYATSIFFLVISLALGLIHIKRKEKFWDEMMNARFICLKKWLQALQKDVTYKEAMAFQHGVGLEKGNIIFSPTWTWVLQTIFLGISIILFFALFLVFLFAKNNII